MLQLHIFMLLLYNHYFQAKLCILIGVHRIGLALFCFYMGLLKYKILLFQILETILL